MLVQVHHARPRNVMPTSNYLRWFDELRSTDTPLVGGKNSSLGELYSALSTEGVRVPNGFAVVAQLIVML